jgi:hypothetical protein
MSERTLYRVGSWAAVLGALLALVFNLLHPRISEFEDPVGEVLREVARSDAWILIHLAVLLGTLLIVLGLFAFARSMKGGPAEGLARLALGALLISTPVAILTLGVDGYATKQVADSVAAAGGASAEGAAVVHIGWALFMMFIITLLGITPALFGLAVVVDPSYPSGLGWAALVLAVVAVIDAVAGTFGGPSGAFFLVFTVTSGLLTLWVLILGVLLGRRALVGAA